MTFTPHRSQGVAALVCAGVVVLAVAVSGCSHLTAAAPDFPAAAAPDSELESTHAGRGDAGMSPHPSPSSTPTAQPLPTPGPSEASAPPTAPAAGASGQSAPAAAGSSSPEPATRFAPSELFATGPLVSRVDQRAIDPASTQYVAPMTTLDFVVSLRRWTVPVYVADAADPRTSIGLTTTWVPGASSLDDVPLPAEARPDPEADAHLSIVDPGRGCVYDLFGATRTGDRMTARLANATPIDSTGAYVDGLGSRASGFSAAAGLIWPEEIAAGSIDHALVFAYPHTRAGGFVSPATKTDGETSSASALPMGARVRLDPTLDLSSLGLNRTERIIATALQRYGMVLADTSGGFTLYAAHGNGLGGDPYTQQFGTTSDWASLAKIPTDRLQVVELPPVQTEQRTAAPTRCADFSR